MSEDRNLYSVTIPLHEYDELRTNSDLYKEMIMSGDENIVFTVIDGSHYSGVKEKFDVRVFKGSEALQVFKDKIQSYNETIVRDLNWKIEQQDKELNEYKNAISAIQGIKDLKYLLK